MMLGFRLLQKMMQNCVQLMYNIYTVLLKTFSCKNLKFHQKNFDTFNIFAQN